MGLWYRFFRWSETTFTKANMVFSREAWHQRLHSSYKPEKLSARMTMARDYRRVVTSATPRGKGSRESGSIAGTVTVYAAYIGSMYSGAMYFGKGSHPRPAIRASLSTPRTEPRPNLHGETGVSSPVRERPS